MSEQTLTPDSDIPNEEIPELHKSPRDMHLQRNEQKTNTQSYMSLHTHTKIIIITNNSSLKLKITNVLPNRVNRMARHNSEADNSTPRSLLHSSRYKLRHGRRGSRKGDIYSRWQIHLDVWEFRGLRWYVLFYYEYNLSASCDISPQDTAKYHVGVH